MMISGEFKRASEVEGESGMAFAEIPVQNKNIKSDKVNLNNRISG